MAPRYFQANRVFGGKNLGRFHQMCGTQQQSLRRRQTVRTLSTPSRPPEALQPLSSCTFLYIFLYLFKMFVRSVPVPSCQRSCEDISFNIGILLWLPDIFRPTGFLVERTWDASTQMCGTQQQSLRRRQTVRTLSTPFRPPEALLLPRDFSDNFTNGKMMKKR